MSLFEEASIIITPNGFKAGKLYAVKGADLNVTRATSATRVNANGVIETMGANVPRLDYSGGGCPSILVEPQRTNLVLNSATVTTQTIITGAVAYTLSFYGSGTITLSGTHTATVVGLGTARKTYTFTPTAGNLILTVSGTCTNGQLEAGSYATSYIPTTSASVTRNADVISKTGISDLIGQTEGTIFIDLNDLFDFDFPLITIDNATNDNRIVLFKEDVTGNLSLFISKNGTDNTNHSSVSSTSGKIAIAYNSSGFIMYRNGVQILTTTSPVPVGMSAIRFNGRVTNDFYSNHKIKSYILWKTRLTNTQLAELTSI